MSELLIAGQTNDEILQSLSYKLAPTSEYIQQRRMSRFYPSGASSYSSNTTQIARIDLKGQGGFLDLSTLKIAHRLVKNPIPFLSFWQVALMPRFLAFASTATDSCLKMSATMEGSIMCSQN